MTDDELMGLNQPFNPAARKHAEDIIARAVARLLDDLQARPLLASIGEYASLTIEASLSSDPNRPWDAPPVFDDTHINLEIQTARRESW